MHRMNKLICITLLALLTVGLTPVSAATNDAVKPPPPAIKAPPKTPVPTARDEKKAQQLLISLSPSEKTALQQELEDQDAAANNPESLLLYEPTFILPFYYTEDPYQSIYAGNTPLNQEIMRQEFYAQLSIQEPIIRHIFNDRNSINFSYTQNMFWQVYAKSQFFRETDYMPGVFFKSLLTPNIEAQTGFVHQSNGRGGEFERSWNRWLSSVTVSKDNWLAQAQVWRLIFSDQSSDLHNPDITQYLGDGQLLFAYKTAKNNTLSLMVRNEVESHFEYGTEQFTWSFPLHDHFRGYILVFSGYGQSLIEYNHYTNGAGIGVTFNDWL